MDQEQPNHDRTPEYRQEFSLGRGKGTSHIQRAIFTVPGMKPGATKRNVLVLLTYLLLFGIVLSLFQMFNITAVAGVSAMVPA